ncbi:MAG: MOSC domain-containing protein [Bacteroidota bacterium]
MTGRLVALYVAPEAGAPMRSVPEAAALAGRGLAGDRYATASGAFSRWPGRGRALTLIAAETIRDAEAAFDVALADGQHRRNLVVEGVPLEDLKGVRFRVGEIELEGVRVCAPCTYLVRTTGQPEAFDALVGRGGLRAEIVTSGVLRLGDAVAWDPEAVANRPRLPG